MLGLRALHVVALGGALACSAGSQGETSSSGEAGKEASSSSTSSGSVGSEGSPSSGASGASGTPPPAPTASSGGAPADPNEATCKAYADLAIRCCKPSVPNCAESTRQGWVDWCLQGYSACPKGYECLAKATCDSSSSCPTFASGNCQ